MKFTNHVGLVSETAVRRDLRPGNRTTLRADQSAVQALDAKHAFWREADLLHQARVQRPHGQASLTSHVLDASVVANRKVRDSILVRPLPAEKIRNDFDGSDGRVRFD